MAKTFNWGIIGPGKIARKFASDLLLAEKANLYAVGSRDLQKAREFATEYDANKFYGSYQELANDPTVDIVYVATPHVFHFENTMMCLKAGKSVLCEKPFAMNTAQVRRMTEEAQKRKLFLMEAIWTRFIPGTEEFIKLLDQKIIGEISSIHADFGFRAPTTSARLFERSLGGGALLDVGIYPAYLALLTLGAPANIQATARMTQNQVDSFCAMLFEYDSGSQAVLACSVESQTPTEAYIHGEKGTIKLHSRFHHPTRITLSLDNGEDQILDIPYAGFGYYHEIVAINENLQNGEIENKKMSHQMSIQLIATLDSIRQKIGLTYEAD